MKTLHILQRKSVWIAGAFLFAALFIGGCSQVSDTGTVSLAVTDAPIVDAADVEGVYIKIDSIAYNVDNTWVNADDFEGPQTFNLLELNNGNVEPLANTSLSSGTVTQIRFILEASTRGTHTSSGCYVAIDPDGTADGDPSDDVHEPLFLPSGSQTGYKANGPFDVPVNGTVEITADFDVRKSVVYTGNRGTGSGTYLLKPTIRLIVNDQAGSISGDFTPDTAGHFNSYVIFAYESGTYSSSEETAEDDESPAFANAVSSTSPIDSNGDEVPDTYTLAFLAPISYDLIIAGVDTAGSMLVTSTDDYTNITVTSEGDNTIDIEL
ncbi:MAG: DUF4382 domain-containing protein [Candidatus Marinimicrobia bacterium]|nr:DUF4382 domain-containing protein [Candidatus Neomarinimicrobiota bacterium]